MATPYQLRQECYHPSYAPNDFAWQYSPSFQRKRRRSGPRSTHYPRLLAPDENKTSNHLPKKKVKVTPMKYMKRSPMKYMKARVSPRVSPIKFMKGSPKTKAMRNCRQEKRMYPLRVVLPGERKTQTPTSTRSTRATDKEESSRSRSARRRQLTAQSSDESKKKDVMTPRQNRKRARSGLRSPKQEVREQSASREKQDASTSSTSLGTLQHAICRHCHHFDVDAFLASRIEPLLCKKVEAPEVRVKLRRSLEQRKNPHSLECVSHLFFKGMPLSEIAEAMELDSEELLRLVTDPEAPT